MTTITDELPLHSTELLPSTMLDLPALATAFSRRLRDAGMPITTAQAEQYALSLALVKPSSRHALYWTTRAVFVTGQQQLTTFDRVFGDVFSSAPAKPQTSASTDDPVQHERHKRTRHQSLSP